MLLKSVREPFEIVKYQNFYYLEKLRVNLKCHVSAGKDITKSEFVGLCYGERN